MSAKLRNNKEKTIIGITIILLVIANVFFFYKYQQSKAIEAENAQMTKELVELERKLAEKPKEITIIECDVPPTPTLDQNFFYITEANKYDGLTPNFAGFELINYNCPDRPETTVIHKNLVFALQYIRDWGNGLFKSKRERKIFITSANRTLKCQSRANKTMKNPENSKHTKGLALDAQWIGALENEYLLAMMAYDLSNGGALLDTLVHKFGITDFGIYKTHFHLGIDDPENGKIDCGGVMIDIWDYRYSLLDEFVNE